MGHLTTTKHPWTSSEHDVSFSTTPTREQVSDIMAKIVSMLAWPNIIIVEGLFSDAHKSISHYVISKVLSNALQSNDHISGQSHLKCSERSAPTNENQYTNYGVQYQAR